MAMRGLSCMSDNIILPCVLSSVLHVRLLVVLVEIRRLQPVSELQ